MKSTSLKNTLHIAAEIRRDVIRMHRKGSGVGSALSIADMMAVLYFDTMRIEAPDDPDRDRLILSKGHAAAALYSVLAQKDFIPREMLDSFLEDGGLLTGHPVKGLPGIELATGSLGHGPAIAIGMALTAKHDRKPYRIFVLMGDGELQEGSVWEAATLAARFGLDNLVVLVDANGLQGYDRVNDIMPMGSLGAKWEAFGWNVREIDGHDHEELSRTLKELPFKKGSPSAVIAHTVKGRGVREMEDRLEWHYLSVGAGQADRFIGEIEE